MNNTKIIGTIGPSSFDKSILRKMFAEGLNVVRINFSHSDHEKAAQIYQWVQELNEEENRNVATLGDLQGPKLRIGEVKENQTLTKGEKITITTEKCLGDTSKIYITYPNFPKDVEIGDKIMLDDGKLILKAENSNKKNEVQAVVIQGGELKSKKRSKSP